MIEACTGQHLPNRRVAPIVMLCLRPYADVKIIVTTLEVRGNCEVGVPIETNHVLLQLLEGSLEGLLVVFTLALAETDHTAPVADVD